MDKNRPSPHPSPRRGEGEGEGVWNFEFGYSSLIVIWYLEFGAPRLLADAHQGETSSQTEEYRGDPTSEKGREDARFSEGYKNVEDDTIGKADHHAASNTQSHPTGPAGFQCEWDANQDHDQV